MQGVRSARPAATRLYLHVSSSWHYQNRCPATFPAATFCALQICKRTDDDDQDKYMNAIFTCHADLATFIVLKLEYIGEGSGMGCGEEGQAATHL